MNKRLRKLFTSSVVAATLAMSSVGCQTCVSPHPFATMFQSQNQRLADEIGSHHDVVPATLRETADEHPDRVRTALGETGFHR